MKIHLSELLMKIKSTLHYNKDRITSTQKQTRSSGTITNKTYHYSKAYINKSPKTCLPHKKNNENPSIGSTILQRITGREQYERNKDLDNLTCLKSAK